MNSTIVGITSVNLSYCHVLDSVATAQFLDEPYLNCRRVTPSNLQLVMMCLPVGLSVGLTCVESGLGGLPVLAKLNLYICSSILDDSPNQDNFAHNGVTVVRVFRLGPSHSHSSTAFMRVPTR